jgi:acetyl coenzyme A synthetase (ADP forming)-like protein
VDLALLRPDRPRMGAVVRDVILRGGGTLRLRAPEAADADGLVAFFTGLSDRSLYLRFHAVAKVSRSTVERFLDPDWVETGALVGTLAEADEERIVALGSWARLREPTQAEASFAVEDRSQGRGVGTRLLEQLAETAAGAGIEGFVAEVLPENSAMLGVFRDAGFEVTRHSEGETVEVRFPIAPTETYRASIDRRDHEAVVASLQPFFAPRSVAVIGASARRGSIGGELFRNILAAEFVGAAYPVNRSATPVSGVHAFSSLGDVPGPVDLAVICLPAEHVLEAAESAVEKGVRALCVISAGFAEVGAAGAEREARLLALARRHEARLIGPNCLGISVAAPQLNATFAPQAFPPGRIAFSSQSGALGLALLEESAARGLGFSAFVSIGNKADVSSNDLIEYWEDDPATDLVLLYLESFGNPRKFGRLARRVARSKPIVAMKSGVTGAGARAAGSHTAALAGSDEAVSALFDQAGVIRTTTLEELVDVATFFSTQPLPSGRRVAVLTNAGGLGILCADACDAAGLELASLSQETRKALAGVLPAEASLANPVDMLGSATAPSYAATLPLLLADPGVDAAIVLFVPAADVDAGDVSAAVERSRGASSAKPVLSVVMAAAAPRGSFRYPESAARALGRAAERTEWLRRPEGSPLVPEGIDEEAARAIVADALDDAADRWLDPSEARVVLAAYGIPLVEERLVPDADEAAAAARELGFPAVVKSAAAGVHKTELGGVALDLRDEAKVRAAAQRIGGTVVVQPMVSEGVELLVGLVQDPMFGPLVAFGAGGVLAELVGGTQFRIAPLTDVDAEELVLSGKAGRLVQGFRGRPAADSGALIDLVGRVARLGENRPEVAELDLNPVLGLPDRCVAVDARLRVRRPEPSRPLKTW